MSSSYGQRIKFGFVALIAREKAREEEEERQKHQHHQHHMHHHTHHHQHNNKRPRKPPTSPYSQATALAVGSIVREMEAKTGCKAEETLLAPYSKLVQYKHVTGPQDLNCWVDLTNCCHASTSAGGANKRQKPLKRNVGLLRFLGPVEFASPSTTIWAGIELQGATIVGNPNDGSVDGIRYFTCPAGQGLFVEAKWVRKSFLQKAPINIRGKRNNQSAAPRLLLNHRHHHSGHPAFVEAPKSYPGLLEFFDLDVTEVTDAVFDTAMGIIHTLDVPLITLTEKRKREEEAKAREEEEELERQARLKESQAAETMQNLAITAQNALRSSSTPRCYRSDNDFGIHVSNTSTSGASSPYTPRRAPPTTPAAVTAQARAKTRVAAATAKARTAAAETALQSTTHTSKERPKTFTAATLAARERRKAMATASTFAITPRRLPSSPPPPPLTTTTTAAAPQQLPQQQRMMSAPPSQAALPPHTSSTTMSVALPQLISRRQEGILPCHHPKTRVLMSQAGDAARNAIPPPVTEARIASETTILAFAVTAQPQQGEEEEQQQRQQRQQQREEEEAMPLFVAVAQQQGGKETEMDIVEEDSGEVVDFIQEALKLLGKTDIPESGSSIALDASLASSSSSSFISDVIKSPHVLSLHLVYEEAQRYLEAMAAETEANNLSSSRSSSSSVRTSGLDSSIQRKKRSGAAQPAWR